MIVAPLPASYPAVVVSASSSQPAPASTISYEVRASIDGRSVRFPRVAPHPSHRWPDADSEGNPVHVRPFVPGTPVSLVGFWRGSRFVGHLTPGELADVGPCPEGGG